MSKRAELLAEAVMWNVDVPKNMSMKKIKDAIEAAKRGAHAREPEEESPEMLLANSEVVEKRTLAPPQSKKLYRALCRIVAGNNATAPGEHVSLTPAQVESLMAQGAIEEV